MTDTDAGGAPALSRRFCLLVAAFISLQLVFASTAFRIDEPNILSIARAAAQTPFDPYSFSINWLGTAERAFDILANPPLVPLWLAVWGTIFGWSEVSMHLSMLPFTLLAVAGTILLAHRFGLGASDTLLLLISSPAFLVASHTIMPDITAVALSTLAVERAMRYRDSGSRFALSAALACGFLAPIAKYNAIVIIPVLGLVWLTARQRSGGLTCAMLAPIGGLTAWSLWSWLQYDGQIHFFEMTFFQNGVDARVMLTAVVVALGMAVAPIVLLIRSDEWLGTRTTVAVIISGAMILALRAYSVFYERPSIILMMIGGTLGCLVFLALAAALARAVRVADHDAAILTIWVTLGLVLLLRLLFIAPRYMLPILPPLLALLGASAIRAMGRRVFAYAVATCALFSVAVAIGDARAANIYRAVTVDVIEPLVRRHERVFFSGHWGFQEYAQRTGALQYDQIRRPAWRAGDVAVVALTPAPDLHQTPRHPGLTFARQEFQRSTRWPLHTIDQAGDANFHASQFSDVNRRAYLSFCFSNRPTEQFVIYTAHPTSTSESSTHAD